MTLTKIENGTDAYNAIEHLASLKTKEKQEKLAEYMKQSEFFVRILKAAYDPFVTYGIKKIPKYTPADDNTSLSIEYRTFAILDRLASRELTGNAAIAAVKDELTILNGKSAELLVRILKKDLRAGFTAKSINKAVPETIFVFDCMLSHKYEPKRIKDWPVAVEPKYDGVRALIIKQDDKISIHSRTGKTLKGLSHIIDALAFSSVFGDWVFDGEVIHPEGFNEIVGAVHRKDEQSSEAIFQMFDCLSLSSFKEGKSLSRRNERKAVVDSFVEEIGAPFSLTPFYLASSHEEIEHFYQAIRDKGGEGVIVKDQQGIYECKRSYNWLKIKDRQTVDIPIIGFEEGTGKNKGKLGALVCDLQGVEVNVGGGLSDQQREEIWKTRLANLNRLVEVEYHEKTPDGSLRHPRFIRFRDDKPVEDGVGV